MTYTLSQVTESIGTITLDHERRRNALSHPLVEEVIAALRSFQESKVRVVILRAKPGAKVFSAGHNIDEESMQNRGVITPLLTPLLLPCGHHSRAGSPDSVDGRRPRACHSARLCVRPRRAAPSLCSSASAAPCSCAWPRPR